MKVVKPEVVSKMAPNLPPTEADDAFWLRFPMEDVAAAPSKIPALD